MKKSTIKNLLNDLKYVMCAVLVVAFIGCMFPMTATYAFTGSESADDSSAFASVQEQNRYKVWSIFKTYGMTDAQVIGILANFEAEGGMYPQYLEGNLAIAGNTFDEKVEYFNEHHDEYTETLLKEVYKLNDTQIANARKSTGYKTTRPDGKDIHAGYYFSGSGNHGGKGYCGIGMAQWTGEHAESLIEWSKSKSLNWGELEVQIGWMITPKENGGDEMERIIREYKEKTKDSGVLDCTEWWCRKYEAPSNIDTAVTDRCSKAQKLQPELENKGWDSAFGRKVLTNAGLDNYYTNNGIQDVGIIASYSGVVLEYPLNIGNLLEDKSKIFEAKNEEVYAGYVDKLMGEEDTSNKYCLYELFGEDLHWYRYFGEETYIPALYDHIYSAWDQDKLGKLSLGDTLFYNNYNYLSCSVYPKRPTVLNMSDLRNGYRDPRVDMIDSARFTGYTYEVGTMELTFAKYITSFINFLLGHELLDKITETVTSIEESDVWKALLPLIWIMIGLCMIALVVSLVKKAHQFYYGRNGSVRDIVSRFLIGILCLGLLLSAATYPSVFNNVINKATFVIDNVFNDALNMQNKDDDVVGTYDTQMTTSAAIWRTAIFNPWCRGQFSGLSYDELYTQYAKLEKGQSAMPQSKEVIDYTDKSGKAYYDSAAYTGDIYVPIGGGKEVRNWAAYLMSCGSIYHIDSTVETDEYRALSVKFPMANTTAGNPDLMADTFRVIDAQMDISPEHYADGTVSYNYTGAEEPDTFFMSEGATMLVNSLLLFMLLPALWMRIKNFFILILSAIQIIYGTIYEFFRENQGLKDAKENFKKAFVGYFVAAVKIYIMVLLYITFVDKGFIMALIYIVLCLTVYGFNVTDIKRFVSDTKHNARRIADKI